MSQVIHINDKSFSEETKEGWVLLDFWAEWCGPCRALSPVIDELAKSYEGRVKVCKINVDENQDTAAQFGIRGIPTVILFQNGEVVETLTGNNPQKIKELVQNTVGE